MAGSAKGIVAALAMLLPAACAGPGPDQRLSGARSVFHNPFASQAAFRDEMRIDGLFYPGRGRFAYDRRGRPVRLRREEIRAMRDRAAALRSTLILREALEKGERVPIPLNAPWLDEDGEDDPSPDAPLISAPVSAPAPGRAEPR